MDIPASTYWRRLYYKKMTWRDFAEHIDLVYCMSGPAGCPEHWEQSVHDQGRMDNNDRYHWSGFDRKYRRNQLHKFLFQVAYRNQQFRDEPEWLGIYHASTWAQDTASRVFKVRLAQRYSNLHRRRVHDLAIRQKVGLRWVYPQIWDWCRQPKKMREGW